MLQVNHWLLKHIISITNFLLTILFVSFILRSKRPPGSTSAWLLFITLFPYVGIPFYIIFSGRKIGSRLQSKEALFDPRNNPIKNYETFETLLERMGNPPARFNSKATLITTGEGALSSILKMIEEAKSSIHLTTFIFADDSVGEKVLDHLTRKATEGLEVCILLDSFGSTWVKQPSFHKFKLAGGKIGFFMPLIHIPTRGRANLRNHRKTLIVDSQTAILGGMNIAMEYMGPSTDDSQWVDLAFEIQGPSVADIETIFAKDWKFATRSVLAPSVTKPEPSTHSRLQIVASGPDVIGDSLYDSLLTLIYQAKKRIWIATPYFIPDESLAKALQLASQRGIEVKILIPKTSNHLLADLARGSYIKQLVGSGCHFYFLPKMIHAKAFWVDQELGLIGSANFDMRSLLYNFEIGAFLTSQEGLTELEKWFDKHFKMSEVSTKAMAAPAFWGDLTQGLGRVLGPLI